MSIRPARALSRSWEWAATELGSVRGAGRSAGPSGGCAKQTTATRIRLPRRQSWVPRLGFFRRSQGVGRGTRVETSVGSPDVEETAGAGDAAQALLPDGSRLVPTLVRPATTSSETSLCATIGLIYFPRSLRMAR